jgi:hypothetical protein
MGQERLSKGPLSTPLKQESNDPYFYLTFVICTDCQLVSDYDCCSLLS